MVIESENVPLKNWKLNYYSARISELELLEKVVREGADFSNILEVIQLFTIEVMAWAWELVVELKSLTMMKKEIGETIAQGNLVPKGPMD